jgi:hypothetical protein
MSPTMKRIAILLLTIAPAVASADKELAKGATWDCKKDPVVHIGNGKGTYTFKGACTSIAVAGGQNTLKIEAVDTLTVGGAKNKITVGTVDTIDVGGAGNKITWKKAKTGDKPTLTGQPDKNTITKAK